MSNVQFSEEHRAKIIKNLTRNSTLTQEEISYFVFQSEISNQAYYKNQPIKIVNNHGELSDIIEESDQLNLQVLSKPVTKHFLCYPKKMELA